MDGASAIEEEEKSAAAGWAGLRQALAGGTTIAQQRVKIMAKIKL